MLPRRWRQVELGVKRGDQAAPNQLPQGSGDCHSPARQFQSGLVQRMWRRSRVADCGRGGRNGRRYAAHHLPVGGGGKGAFLGDRARGNAYLPEFTIRPLSLPTSTFSQRKELGW
jgi:outer membrane receptor protein involved in Fe transport